MGLESASFISQLTASNPDTLDQIKDGDNHIRLIKAVLQNTFPSLSFSVTFNSTTKTLVEAADMAAVRVLLDVPKLTADNEFISTDPGALAGPVLKGWRNSASAADADLGFKIEFEGNDDAGSPAKKTYSYIQSVLLDTAAAGVSGALDIYNMIAGASTFCARLAKGLVLGAPTGGDQGTGTINATAYYENGTRGYWTSLRGATNNLLIVPNGASPNSKHDVTIDEVILKDANGFAKAFSAVSVTLDIAAAAGPNALDTGAEANSTWYNVFAVGKADGTIACVYSTAARATGPSFANLAGYTYWGFLGTVRNGTFGDFDLSYQRGNRTSWLSTTVFSSTAPAVADTWENISVSGHVPPSAVIAHGTMGVEGTGTTAGIGVASETNAVGAVYSNNDAAAGAAIATFGGCAPFSVVLRTAQRFAWKAVNTSAIWQIKISGWEY